MYFDNKCKNNFPSLLPSYLQTLYQLSWMACVAEREQTATTRVMLNTALPTTLPTPMSSLATKAPMTEVASSGAELPAAMKVAPATSGLRPRAKTGNGFTSVSRKTILCKYFAQTGIRKPLTVGNSVERRNEIIFANYCKP